MNQSNKQTICPVEKAGLLDNFFRRWIQNPDKILANRISGNSTVVDLGCGPGFFTVEIAKRLGNSGKVIAVDVQQTMLDILKNKIKNTPYEPKIILHKAGLESLNLTEKADFILAFYVVHEINRPDFYAELKSILKPSGRLFIVEPGFHVTRQVYNKMIEELVREGFQIVEHPKIFFSRAVVLELKNTGNETSKPI